MMVDGRFGIRYLSGSGLNDPLGFGSPLVGGRARLASVNQAREAMYASWSASPNSASKLSSRAGAGRRSGNTGNCLSRRSFSSSLVPGLYRLGPLLLFRTHAPNLA